jgi:DNA-directed RNA polymerase subunit K/omega
MIDTSNISVVVKPRDLNKINSLTGNLYNSVVVVSKRANALSKQEKEELVLKLAEFAPKGDNLEEIFDNREQMEISAHYERLPKSTLIALEELLDDRIYYRKVESSEDVENVEQ